MSGALPDDDTRDGELLRRVTARAIRRLDVLEFVIFGVAAVLATAAGALVALLATAGTALPFRPVWVVTSLLFFAVPAALAWWSEKRRERRATGGPDIGHDDSRPTRTER